MFSGQPPNRRDTRSGLVDLNLIPPEFRPRPFPFLTAGLCALLFGSLLLFSASFWAKANVENDIDQLGSRVAKTQAVVEASTGDPAALAHQEQLRVLRDDYKSLSQRQINWGDIFQVIGDVPAGIIVRTASQTGYGVTVSGSAVNPGAAADYLDRLRNSGLFVNSAIQMGPASGSDAFDPGTPTFAPTTPPPPPGPAAGVVPPNVPVASTPTIVKLRPQSSQSRPVATHTRTASRATVTPTSSARQTPTVTASPTPAFDFILKSTQQIPSANPYAPNADIKGSIVDVDGNPVTGFQVEIDSEGQPPWSSLSTTSQLSGMFDFNVTHGKFKVFVLDGNSETAIDLFTGADGTPGTYGYIVVFQTTFSGTIMPGPTGTPTPTSSSTSIPTDTATPVSAGQNGFSTPTTVSGSITRTSTPTITATATPAPSLTPLPPVVGKNIAPAVLSVNTSSSPYTCPGPAGNGPTFPCSAIDDNPSSFWAPVVDSADPQGITISLPSGSYTNTEVISDIRILVQSAGAGRATVYQIVAKIGGNVSATCRFTSPASGYPDSTQLDCPIATPVAGVDSVGVTLTQNGTQDGMSGIREVQVFKQTSGTATPTQTQLIPTATPTQPQGLGLGPGEPPSSLTPTQPPLHTGTATPTAPVGNTGAIDFTIILEVSSGAGY